MTDKHIIIDGVDVSGCCNLEKDCDNFYCQEYGRNVYCNSNSNCYYKQLKYKEQECERWEEINKYSQDKLLEQVKVVCKLKQTLTEIKEIAMGIMDDDSEESSAYYDAKRILQKISEVEDV